MYFHMEYVKSTIENTGIYNFSCILLTYTLIVTQTMDHFKFPQNLQNRRIVFQQL